MDGPHQAPLSSTVSWSLLKFMCIDSVMLSNHLIHPLPPSSFFCLQPFPASGSFPVNQSGGQSVGVSASTSVLPMNTQDWFSLGLTGWISLLSKGLLQQHSSKVSIFWHSAFFMVHFSHPYMTTGKTIALTIRIFVGTVISLFFNMLSRFLIAFLPRSKDLWRFNRKSSLL